MGKLEGKVAVITGGSSGLALESAKRFVEEGAYVFITGRRQVALDEAVKLIGRNVFGVRGDAANLDDLDRLFDTVKREKGEIDVLFASAGKGEALKLGEITEQHFDAAFGLNARGTLFTVQKALPLFNDGGLAPSATGTSCFGEGFSWFRRVCGRARRAGAPSHARGETNGRAGISGSTCWVRGRVQHRCRTKVLDEEAKRQFEVLIPRGKMGRPEGNCDGRAVSANRRFELREDGVELAVDGGFSAI